MMLYTLWKNDVLNQLKIIMKQIKLPKEKISKIFDESTDAIDAIINLYRQIPGFDECHHTEGYPCVSTKTAKFIMNKLLEKNNDDNTILMTWMNEGFSSDFSDEEKLPDWIIDFNRHNFKLINT